jgi:hypothetical protein
VERFFTRTCPAPEAWQSAALEAVRRCLRTPEIAAALCAEGAALWRERPFEMMSAEGHVSGVFDRVAVVHDAAGRPQSARLLEFKTDRVRSEEDIACAAARHTAQTGRYRAALARLTGLPPERISAALVFTSLPRLLPLA